MGIDKVVDEMVEVHECLCTFETAEPTPHCFDAVLDVAIVPLDVVIVVLQTCEPCLDGDTESECGHIEEQFVEGTPVVPESVADKYHKLAFLLRLVLFPSVAFNDLVVTGLLHLSQEESTGQDCPFLDEKMRCDVLRDMINAIQVIAIFTLDFRELFIKMLSSFELRPYLKMKPILKKRHTSLSSY